MPYMERVSRCGENVMEVYKYNSCRWIGKSKGEKREKGLGKTSEAQWRVNERQAETTLRKLINTNFGKGDLHIVLTYRREERPDPQEGRKRCERFLRRARALYRKNEMELRYIQVTEYKRGAIHHHIIMNRVDAGALAELWEWGAVRPGYLDGRKNHQDLAAYLIKETAKTFREKGSPYGRRWTQSRNLKQPEEKLRTVPANSWRKQPKEPDGWMLDKKSLEEGEHELTGFRYQRYILVKIEREKARCGKRRRGPGFGPTGGLEGENCRDTKLREKEE